MRYCRSVPRYRIADAAALLGVSDDTVRRWVGSGRLEGAADPDGRLAVDGAALAALLRERATPGAERDHAVSARNRLRGLVTEVVRDGVMAQVEMRCGPFRVVSLISRESADELGLEPGVVATASIKATSVVLERG